MVDNHAGRADDVRRQNHSSSTSSSSWRPETQQSRCSPERLTESFKVAIWPGLPPTTGLFRTVFDNLCPEQSRNCQPPRCQPRYECQPVNSLQRERRVRIRPGSSRFLVATPAPNAKNRAPRITSDGAPEMRGFLQKCPAPCVDTLEADFAGEHPARLERRRRATKPHAQSRSDEGPHADCVRGTQACGQAATIE